MAFLGALIAVGLTGCSQDTTPTAGGGNAQHASESTAADSAGKNGDDESKVTVGTVDDATKGGAQPIAIGETVETEQFSVTLTDARADSILQSNQSSTYWEPPNGACFVILEFDVTALTSDKLPVDGRALSDLRADYNGDSYSSWTLSYLSSQLWLYFHNTYLDANLPCHIYAYASVPAEALNSGSLSVSLDIAGEARTIIIR